MQHPVVLDPVTVELIRTRLASIVREMRTVIIRTAYSPMIIEGHDFSSAVLTAQGELVAASELEQPTHISALSWCAKAIVAKYADDIGAGDMFLHNDPYTGGSHLNDVGLFYPVFHDGAPLAMVGVMAHWQDVGGTLGGVTTDIYSEGIQIPIVRYQNAGAVNEDLVAIIRMNVRIPERAMGDLRAQVAAAA